MVTVIVRCKTCTSQSRFVVHDNPAYLTFLCVDCGASIAIDVMPNFPADAQGAPDKAVSA